MKAEDKHIDDFVNKLMKETTLESPSLDFTDQIMMQVEAFKERKITAYKPLISKRIWAVIGLAILSTSIYLFFNTPSNESRWLSQLNFSVITNNNITQTLSGFTLSKTLMYTIVGFALMICVQIPLLKNHFDKRFES